jgi:hypothetical protein
MIKDDIVDPAIPGLALRVGPTGEKRWLMLHHMVFHISAWDAGDSSCMDQFSSSTPAINSDSARTTR